MSKKHHGSTLDSLLKEQGVVEETQALAIKEVMSTTTQKPTDKAQSARLAVRISVERKAVLQRTAALSGRSLSEFIVASAQEVATRIIQQHETISLSQPDQIAFVSALLNPPAPNDRLRRAVKAYRKQMG